MHAVIAWSGFLGAWLLVAGPLFQAAIELDGGENERDWMSQAAQRVDPQPRLSAWWWLLPPVAYVLERRRQSDYRQRMFNTFSHDEVASFVELANVSTGWAMVSGGAFFIAVKETYEVTEIYDWPGWVFAALLVVMLAACAASTVSRVRRAHRMLAPSRGAAAAPAPEPS